MSLLTCNGSDLKIGNINENSIVYNRYLSYERLVVDLW